MQALKISFTTPTNTHGARIKVSALQATKRYGYDHCLSTDDNVEAAAKQFMVDMQWPGELSIGNLGDGVYVATVIPRRFIKARDAVILARRAISQGENNGNVHCKQWGQAITDLTDGVQRDGFAAEYATHVANEGN